MVDSFATEEVVKGRRGARPDLTLKDRHARPEQTRGGQIMKRFLVMLIVAAVAAIGFGSASVFASNGAATPFKATYGTTTVWTCGGAHVVNKATLPGSKDSETCIVSGDLTGFQPGTYTSDPSLGTENQSPRCVGLGALGNLTPFGVTGWESDYFPAAVGYCVLADSWTVVQTDNGNGTFTWSIDAHYPV
jgi:ABC-type transport system substrate-binding protein